MDRAIENMQNAINSLKTHNKEGYLYMNPVDYYGLHPNVSDKEPYMLYGIEVKLSLAIPRGEFYVNNELLDEETLKELESK